jgi:hypothetical protein
MRRFVTLAVLLLFTIPFGVSISGCSKKTAVVYCNGGDAGTQVGQLVKITLSQSLTGISLNQGAIGSVGAGTGYDCKGNVASLSGAVYGTSDRSLVDINPSTGAGGLCAGTWNRNSGGGIADYTVCTPNGGVGIAYITESAGGVTSNAIPVYVHPVVTSIVLGAPSTNCSTDPASNCYDVTNTATATPYACFAGTGAPPPLGTPYTGTSCVSQGQAAQLAARVYAGTNPTLASNNISCEVGPLTFSATTSSVVTIATDGLATAAQPGSTIINASISQASSTAGSFSTCPPASIVLTLPNQANPPTGTVPTSQNIIQGFVANVTDTNGNPLTNIPLTYISTTPVTIPTSGASVTPAYPGTAAITAVCQPPTCNPSSYNQIGLYGNGLPVTSQPVEVSATGTGNSTILYVGSTQSQYIQPFDFNLTTQASPTRLPYAPNSFVLSEDGTSIYMGTPNELMVFSTGTNALTKQDTTVNGPVLAVSPNNTDIVITDPVRQLIYIYATASGVVTEYGGVATAAHFSDDSSTVYITTTDGQLLVYNTFTGWSAVGLTAPASGVAITVPNAGVYLAGNPVDVHTNCPTTTQIGTGINATSTNVFYPEVGPVANTDAYNTPYTFSAVGLVTNNIAPTNDGLHELAASIANGSSPASFTDIVTNQKSGACPVHFTNSIAAALPFTKAAPTTITGVLPTSDSAFAFVTYLGTGGVVPQYVPSTSTLTNIALQTAAGNTAPIAPVAGVVSSDNQTFYVGTSGDNLVHRLARGTNGFTDSLTPLTPLLPNISGSGYATPNLIAQKPIKASS